MKNLLSLLAIFILFSSCDCLQIYHGIVVDKETGSPLVNVNVEVINKGNDQTTTDSSGHFTIGIVSSGFTCPNLVVAFNLENYAPLELEMQTVESDTIVIEMTPISYTSTWQKMQGRWHVDGDSSARIHILDHTWTFESEGQQEFDQYVISLTNKLPQYVDESVDTQFLILSNSLGDTLEYEILGFTDSTMSLMYFPSGYKHLYHRLSIHEEQEFDTSIIPTSQNTLDCSCDNRDMVEENTFQCSVLSLDNDAKLYWQWNCDSAWLTFENTDKVILKSCDQETVYGCDRIGLQFLKEYSNYLLFQYQWISGCCDSPDMVFLSKETGIEIRRIPKEQFVWGEVENDYLLHFSDTTLTSLVFLDHRSEKQYHVEFDTGEIEGLMNANNAIYVKDLFSNFQRSEDEFSFSMRSEDSGTTTHHIDLQ